jgi:dTDP-glucose 4,6-dehydratase
VTNLLKEKKVPVYGTGKNIRDWIYVMDHCHAIDFVLHHGVEGEIYNIGSGNEKTNLDITNQILKILNRDSSSIEFVKDRLGHDWRYSLDSSKLRAMGWKPQTSFETALKETVEWYVRNEWWWQPLLR